MKRTYFVHNIADIQDKGMEQVFAGNKNIFVPESALCMIEFLCLFSWHYRNNFISFYFRDFSTGVHCEGRIGHDSPSYYVKRGPALGLVFTLLLNYLFMKKPVID